MMSLVVPMEVPNFQGPQNYNPAKSSEIKASGLLLRPSGGGLGLGPFRV